ncbi:MAG TPA: helix-turn-helix domain-containing protein [Deltaproteobacteria bacterium]|nr:helix-turn-helix domain-containing protein [Deltaproteobacteria bacterium]HOI05689.1 helix-turn-helix domain-containing protein [Deltaproteobacteria bacterium]
MKSNVVNHPSIERWSAKRKTELVLEIIKGHKTIVDAAREHDLKQSVIEGWINTFLEYGRNGLKSHPKNVAAEHDQQFKVHKEEIGELVLQIDVLKKAKELLS